MSRTIFFAKFAEIKGEIAMVPYIEKIRINKVLHLENFEISVSEDAPHLIITGRNGSGKTILVNAISDCLDKLRKTGDAAECADGKSSPVQIAFKDVDKINALYEKGDFVLAFYQAYRKVTMKEPKNPTKPELNKKATIKDSSTSQFLNFLSDLKIQEALAKNAGQNDDAARIQDWFTSFEQLLQEIYNDSKLKLDFNYKDYSFKISTDGKKFKFTQLSDGFAAAIDIIADLMLKMQNDKSLTRAYDKPGIVIIDEIETHLHLALQKDILKILTKVFPKIQFIVTTHSPFVLSSLENSTAFDLVNREEIEDLADYSYEALAEGYFGIKMESSYIGVKLNTLKTILSKSELSASDIKQAKDIARDFNEIPEMISPLYVGEFRQLMIKYAGKLA